MKNNCAKNSYSYRKKSFNLTNHCISAKKSVSLCDFLEEYAETMINLSQIERKNGGVTFTPMALADFLSERILFYAKCDGSPLTIMDPACGDGALLESLAKKISSQIDATYIGFDTNKDFINHCSSTFSETSHLAQSRFICSDFLETATPTADLFSTPQEIPQVDIIIANPPYVRTQVLGAARSRQLAQLYSLKGKVDLYFAFLVAMTNCLKRGGIVGVITSNRYLTTKSGAQVRKFLLEQYDILEVIDLGDTHLFVAAVLPAIFIGRKKIIKSHLSEPCPYVKIYEISSPNTEQIIGDCESVVEVLKKDASGLYRVQDKIYELGKGLLKYENPSDEIWQMTTGDENAWIEQIDKYTYRRVGELFKVRVGIKSCADNVFLNPAWQKEQHIPEPVLLRNLISQENIQPWHINHNTCMQVLYPYYVLEGKKFIYDIEKYPQAKAYLEGHKEQLQSRKYLIEAGRKWYEMWVPQNPIYFDLPKLVFPDISLNPRFTFDTSKSIVNGNCYWIAAMNKEEEYLLLLIEGISNSSTMTKYHDLKFNNKLYSGRRRYLSQYIEKYPIPHPHTEVADKIVDLTKQLNACQEEDRCLVNQMDELVKQAFNLL